MARVGAGGCGPAWEDRVRRLQGEGRQGGCSGLPIEFEEECTKRQEAEATNTYDAEERRVLVDGDEDHVGWLNGFRTAVFKLRSWKARPSWALPNELLRVLCAPNWIYKHHQLRADPAARERLGLGHAAGASRQELPVYDGLDLARARLPRLWEMAQRVGRTAAFTPTSLETLVRGTEPRPAVGATGPRLRTPAFHQWLRVLLRCIASHMEAPLTWHLALACFLGKGNGAAGAQGRRLVVLLCSMGACLFRQLLDQGMVDTEVSLAHGAVRARRREVTMLIQRCRSW